MGATGLWSNCRARNLSGIPGDDGETHGRPLNVGRGDQLGGGHGRRAPVSDAKTLLRNDVFNHASFADGYLDKDGVFLDGPPRSIGSGSSAAEVPEAVDDDSSLAMGWATEIMSMMVTPRIIIQEEEEEALSQRGLPGIRRCQKGDGDNVAGISISFRRRADVRSSDGFQSRQYYVVRWEAAICWTDGGPSALGWELLALL